jgi:hypothetical protein
VPQLLAAVLLQQRETIEMSNTTKLLTVLGVAFAASVGTAQAQASRTWVSGVGDDVNPCSRTAPCKTFAGAISKTAAAGEISVLDPGGFGAVTITKSMTLNGDGTIASITHSLVNCIIVNGANVKVTIRNVTCQGVGSGTNGIQFLQGAELLVDNMRFTGYTGNAINVSVGGSTKVSVVDTVMTDGARGVQSVHIMGATTAGVEVSANAQISINNSSLSGNAQAVLVSGASGFADISNSDITNNTVGVSISSATGKARLSNNNLYDNATQLFSSGTLLSAGNNRVDPSSAVATTAIQIN